MPDQFRIEVDDEQLLKMLSRAQAEAEDLTPLMEDIEGIMVDATKRAFKNERDPETGAPWAALSPTTQKKEVAAGKLRGAKPILEVSSSLVQSIGGRHDASSAEAGVAEKHGITHQLGAKKGKYGFADGAPLTGSHCGRGRSQFRGEISQLDRSLASERTTETRSWTRFLGTFPTLLSSQIGLFR